tara:strand:- start:136 stop:330 length:195 start_codon:yes stop_codon:yes gene_type:complete
MTDTENFYQNYQTERENEYPSWKDQLDLMYHKGFEEWRKYIRSIKDRYPKPPPFLPSNTGSEDE